jgi:hypothetical protein
MNTANHCSSGASFWPAVLAVGGVQQARDLHLVLHRPEVEVDALGGRMERAGLLVAAGRQGDREGGDEQERDQAAHGERKPR